MGVSSNKVSVCEQRTRGHGRGTSWKTLNFKWICCTLQLNCSAPGCTYGGASWLFVFSRENIGPVILYRIRKVKLYDEIKFLAKSGFCCVGRYWKLSSNSCFLVMVCWWNIYRAVQSLRFKVSRMALVSTKSFFGILFCLRSLRSIQKRIWSTLRKFLAEMVNIKSQ